MNNEIQNVQEERGKNYGKFSDHARHVEMIMSVLKLNAQAKGDNWPDGFQTALFYMVSKLVRLAATPTHEDSALDLGSYADLWLKVIRETK